MTEETTQELQDTTSTPEVSEDTAAPVETAPAAQEQSAPQPTPAAPEPQAAQQASVEAPTQGDAIQQAATQEPDALQPFIDKAGETIQHEVPSEELNQFLRAHIKTFREEWDTWEDNARNAYVHMMTSQLVQRKAAATRIKIYDEFKLPVPSAHTKLYESIKQSQVKPQKRQPVLLMPPNLRPAYALKK